MPVMFLWNMRGTIICFKRKAVHISAFLETKMGFTTHPRDLRNEGSEHDVDFVSYL